MNRVIQFGFIGVLFLMIVNGLASFIATNNLVHGMSWVSHTYEVKWELERFLRRLIDAETGQRGFLYTSDETFLEPYTQALREVQDSQDKLLALIKDNPEQVQRLQSLNELVRQKIEVSERIISLYRTGKQEEAKQIVSDRIGKDVMDRIRTGMAELNQVETKLLERRTKDAEHIQTVSSFAIVGGTVLSIAVGLLVLSIINRKFLHPINDMINIVSTVSTEIAATVNQHERTASQQASAANETSATIEELSVSSHKSAEQAANAAALTEKAGQATSQGNEASRQAVDAMAELNKKFATLAGQILHLGEQTSQIGGITSVLKDLAGQINMLALNAAVEAAHAGEHGKGFAVVASEIRKLADDSKKSAEQTALLVTDIQKATNSSIMMTDDGTRSVNEVAETVQTVAELFDNLAGLSGSANESSQQVMLNAKQQSTAFNQVTEATNSIVAGIKETAAGISQTKTGVQRMQKAAKDLKSIL
ncbi:MAG: CHASE3 domain-containing protein, partial [Gammaproteobacteria bacterium]